MEHQRNFRKDPSNPFPPSAPLQQAVLSEAHQQLTELLEVINEIRPAIDQHILHLNEHLKALGQVLDLSTTTASVRDGAQERIRVTREWVTFLHRFVANLTRWRGDIIHNLVEGQQYAASPGVPAAVANAAAASALTASIAPQIIDSMREHLDHYPDQENLAFLERTLGASSEKCAPAWRKDTEPRPPGDGGGSCGSSAPSGAAGGLGAMAAEEGPPVAIASSADGYAASWPTQARFFEYGQPISNDMNHRRYAFDDGSFVEIQAHVPIRTTTDLSALGAIALVAAGAAAGAMAGAPGMLIGGLLGLLAAGLARPWDAAWQGYTAHYYRAQAPQSVWKTRYFYGWQHSAGPHIPVKLEGGTQPLALTNFADDPSTSTWWSWHNGEAPARAPKADPFALKNWHARAAGKNASFKDVDLLTQLLPTFVRPGAPHHSAAPNASQGKEPTLLAPPQWLQP